MFCWWSDASLTEIEAGFMQRMLALCGDGCGVATAVGVAMAVGVVVVCEDGWDG